MNRANPHAHATIHGTLASLVAARRYRVPVVGTVKDPVVYLSLLTIYDCRKGYVDHDENCLWAVDEDRHEKFRIEFAVIDQLVQLGWLAEVDGEHDRHEVTASGKRWLSMFLTANGGKALR